VCAHGLDRILGGDLIDNGPGRARNLGSPGPFEALVQSQTPKRGEEGHTVTYNWKEVTNSAPQLYRFTVITLQMTMSPSSYFPE
jgi:hypothetical protein